MVDAADPEKIEASKNELHNLLDKPQLQGIPVRSSANFPTESSSQIFDDVVFSSMQLCPFNPHVSNSRPAGQMELFTFSIMCFLHYIWLN